MDGLFRAVRTPRGQGWDLPMAILVLMLGASPALGVALVAFAGLPEGAPVVERAARLECPAWHGAQGAK